MTKKQIIEHLFKTNDRNYNLLKAAEELQELSLALTQLVTKNSKDDTNVIEEIGDVNIRLKVIKKYFSKSKINKRIDYKLGNIRKNIKLKKYINRL